MLTIRVETRNLERGPEEPDLYEGRSLYEATAYMEQGGKSLPEPAELGASPDEAVGAVIRHLFLQGVLESPVRLVMDYKHE